MLSLLLPPFISTTARLSSIAEGVLIERNWEWRGEADWCLAGILARRNNDFISEEKAFNFSKCFLEANNHLLSCRGDIWAELISDRSIAEMFLDFFEKEEMSRVGLWVWRRRIESIRAMGGRISDRARSMKIFWKEQSNNEETPWRNDETASPSFEKASITQRKNHVAWLWLSRSGGKDPCVPQSPNTLDRLLTKLDAGEEKSGLPSLTNMPEMYPRSLKISGVVCDTFDVALADLIRAEQDENFSFEKEERFFSLEQLKDYVAEKKNGNFLFVLKASGLLLFAPDDEKHRFSHSELAGGHRCWSAGEISFKNEMVEELSNSSGHFLPPYSTLPAVALLCEKGGLFMDACVLRNAGSRKDGLPTAWATVKKKKVEYFEECYRSD